MAKATPPRGTCFGCSMEYALYQGTGEHKGELVVRKHLSRVGPGECKGSKKPPLNGQVLSDNGTATAPDPFTSPAPAPEMDRGPANDHLSPPQPEEPGQRDDEFTSPAPVPAMDTENGEGEPDSVLGPWVRAGYGGLCDACDGSIVEGDQIRADGQGGWLCSDCGMVPDVPHVHTYEDADDGNGHSGSVCTKCGEMEPDADPHMTQFMASTGIVPGESPRDMHRKAAAVYGCQNSKPCADCAEDIPFTTPQMVYSDTPHEVIQDPASTNGTLVLPTTMAPDPFTGPGASSDIPESDTTVSGQPDPDRDRWGRYVMQGQAYTRATTFAKLGSNTFAIGQWHERNVIVGLTRRPDLLALAEGLEVKRHRDQLNKIAEQAKDAAGQKIAANLGTAYHAFTERLDAGLITLADVPEKYRRRVQQYRDVVHGAGLTTRPEWIERTTAVTAEMVSAPVPVAGTLDRILQLPDGSLCIGDLKTGSDLSYGMAEIEVQLALYAHGVNRFGLFDWNTKTWGNRISSDQPTGVLRVRTDFAIVIHLPADGDGCKLIRVDLERGWRRAQLRGRIQSDQKEKSHPQTLTRDDLAPQAATVAQPVVVPAAPAPDPWDAPHMAKARELILAAPDRPTVAGLFQYALDSGKFSAPELELMKSLGMKRLRDLGLM